jgi:hypothetical protein
MGQAQLKNEQNQQSNAEKLARIRASHQSDSADNAIGPTVTLWRDGRPVVIDKRTGEEVGLGKRSQSEMDAEAVNSGLQRTMTRMDELANDPKLVYGYTSGVIPTGFISKQTKSFFGPEEGAGPDINNEFDSLGRRAFDLVYRKSGKQINDKEIRILEGLIPSRSKRNIPEQWRIFKDYAESLLAGTGAPVGAAPAPSPAQPSDGAFGASGVPWAPAAPARIPVSRDPSGRLVRK